jgi:galactokinase
VTRAFWAPGRVNLIGEYTDLVGGLVLPVAIDVGVQVQGAAAPEIRLVSRELPGETRLGPGGEAAAGEVPEWGRYAAAVAAELAELGRPPVGFEGEITSSVPAGTGLSSSAALEVALALALCTVADFALEPLELAQAARRAEHRAVGVPCGLMDQAASVLGRAGHALLLDTRTLEHEHVPLPPELALLVVHSGVSRRLEDSAYAERRRELAAAVSRGGADDPTLARRLRHVTTENERVRETVRLLRDPSPDNLARLGDVFRVGHESLRDDLEVTTPELDLLVELAYAAGATAARMTGGGFGGSIVALVPAERAEEVADEILLPYALRGGSGSAYRCRASDGARELV